MLHLKVCFRLYLLKIRMADTQEPITDFGDSIARPTSTVGNFEPNRISDFEVGASYNWLDEKNPTIMVPGKHSHCTMSCFGPRGLLNHDRFRRAPNMESTSHCSCSDTRLWSSVHQPEYRPELGLTLGSIDPGCSDLSAGLRFRSRRRGHSANYTAS